MSLINDVLRDLERRQGADAVAAVDNAVTRALPRPARKPWWPWLLGAAVLGALAHLVYLGLPDQPVEPTNPMPQIAAADAQPLLLAAARPRPADPQTFAAPADFANSGNAAVTAPSPVAADPPAFETQTLEPDPPPAEAETGAELTEALVPAPIVAQAPAVAPTADPSPEPPGRIQIQRSTATGDDHPVDQALRAIARGQLGLAQSHLNAHLLSQPDDVRARLLSAEVLVAQQRPAAARERLETGLNPASAKDIAPALARLLQTSDPAEARQVLLRHPPEPAGSLDYHLLLAALHRQVGAHAEAADLYRRLTRIDPGSATAWVGLGSSLESLGEPDQARSAYQAAAATGDPRLGGFARQRLAALSANGEQP